MTDLSWDDQGEEYDLKSVMHYDGDAFITTEAWLKGESTMTYKGTDERVIVWAERADSIDTVQIAKRYKVFFFGVYISMILAQRTWTRLDESLANQDRDRRSAWPLHKHDDDDLTQNIRMAPAQGRHTSRFARNEED